MLKIMRGCFYICKLNLAFGLGAGHFHFDKKPAVCNYRFKKQKTTRDSN